MLTAPASLPSDLHAAHEMILAERAVRLAAEADAAAAKAIAPSTAAEIAHLRLTIEKLRRELFGRSSERKTRLLEQMELRLEDLEATATEDELAAETAGSDGATVATSCRRRRSRKPFPEHLPARTRGNPLRRCLPVLRLDETL